MPIMNRAAQFAPFAALTGYEDAIEEAGKLTTERKEIDEYLKAEINDKLNQLAHTLVNAPKVSITYFIPDAKKSGGEYVTKVGIVNKIDYCKKIIVIDEDVIKIENVIAVDKIL